MQTNPTLNRAQLRSLCQDTNSSPRSKLDAAAQLLEQFGATARNLRIIKRVAKQFEKHVAASPRTQLQIRFLSEKLKARIEKALAADAPLPDGDEDDAADEPLSVVPQLVGGVHLLPPDEPDDEFWGAPAFGSTRRALFCMAWGFPTTHTRYEMISDLRNDPARLESRTLRLQLWACSKEQLDQKFEADGELIRAVLAERGLEDTDAGRDQLAEQVVASGESLVEFRKRDYDPEGADLPVLVRSKAGLLLDAIEFTRIWPALRCRHQPL